MSIYLNPRLAIIHVDGHHVEAARAIVQAMPGQIVYGHLRQAPLLPCRDGFGGHTELLADASLHFDEHGHAVDGGDDVNFSKPGSVATLENCVPETLELGAGEIFPMFSEDLAGIVRHARFTRHVPRQVWGRSWGRRQGRSWGQSWGQRSIQSYDTGIHA